MNTLKSGVVLVVVALFFMALGKCRRHREKRGDVSASAV